MQRVAWLSDIHLNFVDAELLQSWLATLAELRLDGIFLSGDVGEAHSVVPLLRMLDDALAIPIYFVLGNHDYYFGSIAAVRDSVSSLCQQRPHLRFLTAETWHPLGSHSAVLGHDGWADAREGDYARSYVMMNDYKLIEELAPFNKMERWARLQALGDEAAAHVRRVLPQALAEREHAFLVTHVPPLRSACWYNGTISDDEWSPHFTCKAMGEALLDVMRLHPDRQLTVLCGHTHSSGQTRPLDNVTIHTGSAEYGSPQVQRIFEIP